MSFSSKLFRKVKSISREIVLAISRYVIAIDNLILVAGLTAIITTVVSMGGALQWYMLLKVGLSIIVAQSIVMAYNVGTKLWAIFDPEPGVDVRFEKQIRHMKIVK